MSNREELIRNLKKHNFRDYLAKDGVMFFVNRMKLGGKFYITEVQVDTNLAKTGFVVMLFDEAVSLDYKPLEFHMIPFTNYKDELGAVNKKWVKKYG